MKKFQAIIKFTIDDEFMSFVPSHRTYINYLLNKGIIDSYAVSMESQTCWITLNTDNKAEADKYLAKSPLYKYWTYYASCMSSIVALMPLSVIASHMGFKVS
ncbi:unnamed protein product [marine sediment metagenome]|uniref:Uncharacterized protein n=1 Tax=marine sediment metagenome TaxID=412755 RepID=X1LPX7_9ZZZZ